MEVLPRHASPRAFRVITGCARQEKVPSRGENQRGTAALFKQSEPRLCHRRIAECCNGLVIAAYEALGERSLPRLYCSKVSQQMRCIRNPLPVMLSLCE